MTTSADVEGDVSRTSSKRPFLVGLVLAILGGGGGFFAVQSGLIGSAGPDPAEDAKAVAPDEDKSLSVAFVAIDPLVISLPSAGGRTHLRFAAQLEVPPDYAAEVEAIRPRIVDVLNGYLRAIDIATLEDPVTLTRLRAQMLRRIQVIAGPGRVKDLLIMEFVLS